ncbi:hypothetical protein ACFXGA_27080 [Actinosynnema sp. NPDC059335]|uniref:hypothetical protein n=1 Tax=Actinosynnema sp. NPDC059335 TaxID=3346804 RepID=UPI00366D6E1C
MTRTIHTAPEVAELLGTEQLARMRGPDRPARVQCWKCGVRIDAAEDVAVSVLRVVDPAAKPGVGTVSAAVQTHPACLPSLVLEVTPAQLARIQAAARPPADEGQDHDDEADLDLLATIAGSAERPYPLLLLSYRSDVTVERPAGDRVDLLTSTYLSAGWHPVTTLAEPPGPAPAGHRVLFHHELPDHDAPGVLAVIGSHGVDTTAAVTPQELWRPLARAYGWTVVVHGTNYLADGPEGLERAVRSGLLVGGRVPVDLDGPGNDEAVRR